MLAALALVTYAAWFIFVRTPPPSPVNVYGYAKEDLRDRWTYPNDCNKSGEGYEWTKGLSRCKRELEQFEKDGRVWVDWKKNSPHEDPDQ